jgi:hypothetical protein
MYFWEDENVADTIILNVQENKHLKIWPSGLGDTR